MSPSEMAAADDNYLVIERTMKSRFGERGMTEFLSHLLLLMLGSITFDHGLQFIFTSVKDDVM